LLQEIHECTADAEAEWHQAGAASSAARVCGRKQFSVANNPKSNAVVPMAYLGLPRPGTMSV